VAHCKVAEDFNKDLLCPTSCYQDEVHNKDCTRQQKHRSAHIHWRYGPLQEEKEEVIQFFFCNNDIEWCVKSARQRWIWSRPDIPSI
jgi:hypothetical protein